MRKKLPLPHSSPTLLHYMWRGTLVVAAAAILTFLLHDWWLMKRMQHANLDSWLLSRDPEWSDSIAMIQITEDDYRTLFAAKSPLKPEIVQNILTAIAKSGAEVIGVDIDTSEWIPQQSKTWLSTSNPGVSVVWARDFIGAEHNETLGKVLGQWQVRECWAVPTVFEDEGIVRSVSADVALSDGGRAPTLAAMLASLKRRLDSRLEPECKIDGSIWRMSTEEAGNIQVNFGRHRFQTLSSGSLLKLSQTEAWRNNANVLKGKLVLLGGSFRASRDTHNTPVGRKDGIEILAHSVDTLLPGGRLTRLSDSGFFWIELAVGVILLLPAYYLPRGWSLAILACALPVIAFLASYAAFQIFGYFGSFVPVLAGVFFHEMIEHYLEYHQALATAAGKRR